MDLILSKNWKIIPAEKFCIKVADGTHDSPKQSEEGRFLVTSKNIKNGILDISNSYKISEDDFNEINKRSKVDQWDVLFSMIGTVGEVCVVRENPNFAIKNVGLFKCGDKDKALFLYYFLSSLKGREIAVGLLNGTTQKYITLGELRSFPISIPESSEDQKEIASILDSIDDKIELLRRENKTLESMAQTLFKEWFVDFRFPEYRKSKMINGVPEGWKVGKLTDIAEFLNGVASQKYPAKNINGSLPVIKIREMKSGITSDTDRATSEIDSTYIVNNGDMLFSWSGSLDVVLWNDMDGVLNQHLFKVTSKNYPKWFYYYWVLQHLPEFKSIAASKATTMGHIQRHHLDDSIVLIPTEKIFEIMSSVMKPLLDKQILNNSEIKKLAQIRDSLLNEIFSN